MLSGCGAFSQVTDFVSSAQSKTEACIAITGSLSTLGQGLADASGRIVTDPQGAASDVHDLATAFATEADALKNDEVRAAAMDTAASVTALSDMLDDFAADPASADTRALTTAGNAAQEKMAAIGEACTP
jgi:hypothetical protein